MIADLSMSISSIAVSEKGWTDRELGVEWIKLFDKCTKHKNNKTQLLIVDRHGLHCTLNFIKYAAAHGIKLLSYPPHSTHVLQGLDVAMFGTFKTHWGKVRQQFECEKGEVTKDNFLEVVAPAWQKTFQ
jgi:hypothetical protein